MFRNSWLLLSRSRLSQCSCTNPLSVPGCSQKPRRCFSWHLTAESAFLRQLGTYGTYPRRWASVAHEAAEEDDQGKYHDVEIALLPGFDYRKPEFIDLSVEMDDNRLAFCAGSAKGEVPVAAMPYVYSAGKVRAAAAECHLYESRRLTLNLL